MVVRMIVLNISEAGLRNTKKCSEHKDVIGTNSGEKIHQIFDVLCYDLFISPSS